MINFQVFCIIIAILLHGTTCSAANQDLIVPPEKWKTEPTWSPDGSMIAVRGEDVDVPVHIGEKRYHYLRDGNMFILRSKDYSVISKFRDAHLAWPSWSPNGKLLASRFDSLEVYDAITGSLVLKNEVEPPSWFAWSPDSSRILAVDRKSFSMFDLGKKQNAKFHSEQHDVYWESPTPDGTAIAAISTLKEGLLPQCEIKVWNSVSYDPIRTLKFKSRVGSISWTPDGSLFLYSVPESIRFDDSKTNRTVREINTKGCAKFSWSPLKKHLAYKDEDLLHRIPSKRDR